MDQTTSSQPPPPSSFRESTGRFLRKCTDKCGFCGCTGNLETCDCGCVAYCSKEHQKFDWKKHKPICKIVQSKIGQPFYEPIGRTSPITPRASAVIQSAPKPSCPTYPIIEPATSTQCPKTELSPPSSVTSSIPNVDSPVSSNVAETGETIIETDDPDIQIIEGPGTQGTPLRSRKRAINPRVLKDHSQNMAYSISPDDHRHYLMEQGRTFNHHQSAELRLTYISEHILRSLTEFGWAVVDNFLGADHCWHIHKEVRKLETRGLFGAGQVANDGKFRDQHHVKDIRSDKTYWFDGTDAQSSDACTVRMLVTYLDSIVHRFSRRLQGNQIQGRSRAMLAIYPGNGSRYVKHVDNPAKDGRRITVIYYCNPDWDYKVDGGVLRLYPETSATPLDIEPRADRLIAFWSDHRVPHEVMPVYKDRLAITVWYMDRNERDQHIKKVDPKTPATSAVSSTAGTPQPSVEPKGIKEKRMDTSDRKMDVTLPRMKVEDNELDEVDSGTGRSSTNTISNRAASMRSMRTVSQDSAHLSDDEDEDHLPRATDMNPEYNI